MKIGTLGGSGFIGKCCVNEFLLHNYKVVNIDLVEFPIQTTTPNFRGFIRDLKKADSWGYLVEDCDIIINFAAKLGGINYFNKYPATLLLENELICASVFEVAKCLYQNKLKKIIQLSSSMVYESTNNYPSIEGDERKISSPKSVYGFQKLASEYWCQAYNEEYGLPYVVVRPFNAIGIGEDPIKDSHVIPQLVYKVLKGQNPLKLLGWGDQIRQYTHIKDIANAMWLIVESDCKNTSFNVVNENNQIIVFDLAKKIWKKINPKIRFEYQFSPALKYDVQERRGSSKKICKELGWRPKMGLDQALDEIIEDMKKWVNSK